MLDNKKEIWEELQNIEEHLADVAELEVMIAERIPAINELLDIQSEINHQVNKILVDFDDRLCSIEERLGIIDEH